MRDYDQVDALLKSGKLTGNNLLQVLDYERRLHNGFLSNEDRSHLRALYAWFITGSGGASTDPARSAANGARARPSEPPTARLREAEDAVIRAQQRIRELEEVIEHNNRDAAERLRRTERRAHEAELKLKEQADHAAAGHDGRANDHKFRQAKRLFARLYHPDNAKGEGLERLIRIEFFKEFWQELERIDRSE